MAGRPASPIELQLFEGNPGRLTKGEIEFRRENEIRIGSPNLKSSKQIRANPIALKEWRRIVKLYRTSDASFITDADQALLERRCLVHSDYEHAREMRVELEEKQKDMSFEAKLQATNRIDTMLARLSDQLQSMDRELLLTPLSRISGLSKSGKRATETPGARAMFGDE